MITIVSPTTNSLGLKYLVVLITKNSVLASDSSLAFTKVADTLPAFDLELYTDYNFVHEYESNGNSSTFNVTKSGTVGVDGKLVLTYNNNTPDILYYNLVANTDSDNPDINKEFTAASPIISMDTMW